jgi:hypothetical protein
MISNFTPINLVDYTMTFFCTYIISLRKQYNMLLDNEITDIIPPESPTNTENSNNNTVGPDSRIQNEKEMHANKKRVEWSPENELIMVEWCDVAQCYKWLNTRSHAKYSYMHAWFTIPAIIFSTVSGTASFAQDSFPTNIRAFAPAVIGSINIMIGILTTIQQYLKISELNEAHRVSAIAWDKFSRNIRIELSKKPCERSDAGTFTKHCRSEFDRLMETSPDIIEKVVAEFKTNFSGKEGTLKRRRYEELKKPDICDTIISANETRHKWYLELDNDVDNMNNELTDVAMQKKNSVIIEQQRLLRSRDAALTEKAANEQKSVRLQIETLKNQQTKQIERDNHIADRISLINVYVKNFVDIYERKPLREEVVDNMAGEVDNEIFEIFFATYNSTDNV